MNVVVADFQRDLFESPREEYLRMRLEAIEAKMEAVKVSADKVRRGAYANINELRKQVSELSVRLEAIERGICREQQ